MSGVVHLAGDTIRVGPVVRVRCAWCGALIDEVDVERSAVCGGVWADDERGNPRPLWKGLVRVEVRGGHEIRVAVDDLDDDALPEGSCLALDSEVTR